MSVLVCDTSRDGVVIEWILIGWRTDIDVSSRDESSIDKKLGAVLSFYPVSSTRTLVNLNFI
jgi:hypothetical protein